MIKSKSNYVNNVVMLLSGNMFAQLMAIIVTPLLTRLYTPEEFGVLAVFLSVSLIIGSIINARYELAIMLPSSDDEAKDVVFLCLVVAFFISGVILIFLLIFPVKWYADTPLSELRFSIYFIPLVTMLMGVFNAFNYYSSRKEQYKLVSYANVAKAGSTVGSQTFLSFTQFGLIFGYCIGTIVSSFWIFKCGIKFGKISPYRLKQVAIRYKKFPQYSMWAILANALSVNLLNLVVGSIFSFATLGYYSLLQRVLGMPITMLGASIGQVFYKEIVNEKNTTGKGELVFRKTAKNLILISVVTFTPSYFLLPDLFGFAFGEDWVIAGEYAQILTPLFALRFVTSALTLTNSAFEKQSISFYWQMVLLFLTVLIILSSYILKLNFISFLAVYNAVISIHYVVLLYILFLVSKGRS